MELNVQDWKEFNIARLCYVDMGNKFDNDKMTYERPSINFVSRTANNNGVSDVVDEILGVTPYQANSVTVALGGSIGSCYLQTKPFYTGQNVSVLLFNANVPNNAKLFITTMFMNECKYKYVAFGRELNVHIRNDFTLYLPIKYNEDNTPVIDENKTYSDEGYIPDWQFMEDYIKSLHHKPITTKVKSGLVKELDVYNREEFKVSGLFTLLNGKGITKEEIEENSGTFVAVQSGEENNGVLGKIDKQYCIKMGYTLTDKMCLTVARTGSAGFVSFQSAGCVVGDSAKILLLDDDIATTSVYLFLQTVLTANRFKYDYGRKVTEDKYLSDIIKLPIKRDSDGKPVIDDNRTYSDSGYIPDWQFMEDYINSLPYSDRI